MSLKFWRIIYELICERPSLSFTRGYYVSRFCKSMDFRFVVRLCTKELIIDGFVQLPCVVSSC